MQTNMVGYCSVYLHPDNLTPITIKEDQQNVCFHYSFDKEKQWKLLGKVITSIL